MYIDHISGSLQNFNNSMRGLQNLAELDEQRRKRQLQASIEAKDRGDNPIAERLFLESQRGLLGNMFGSDSKEWEINNPYRGKESSLQSLIATPEKQQVQTLKDINAVNELKKIYGNNTEALNKQLGLMGLTQAPQDIISGYDNKVAQNKEIEGYNRKAEAYNKKLSNVPKSYAGNESYQNQQILEDAMNAISNAGTMQEKLQNYNRYLTAGKAIADHYGHRFEAQPAAFFGIGSGEKAGGAGTKTDRYIIKLNNGKEVSVELPKGHDPDSPIGMKMARQKLKLGKDEGWTPGAWNPLSSDSSYMTEAEKNKSNIDRITINDYYEKKANDIYKKHEGTFYTSKADIDNMNRELQSKNIPFRYDYDGVQYPVNAGTGNIATSNNEEPKKTNLKHLDKFRVK